MQGWRKERRMENMRKVWKEEMQSEEEQNVCRRVGRREGGRLGEGEWKERCGGGQMKKGKEGVGLEEEEECRGGVKRM